MTCVLQCPKTHTSPFFKYLFISHRKLFSERFHLFASNKWICIVLVTERERDNMLQSDLQDIMIWNNESETIVCVSVLVSVNKGNKKLYELWLKKFNCMICVRICFVFSFYARENISYDYVSMYEYLCSWKPVYVVAIQPSKLLTIFVVNAGRRLFFHIKTLNKSPTKSEFFWQWIAKLVGKM